MSTSLLYHAFGIRGYQYTRTDYQDGQVIFTIHQEPKTCRFSACGSPRVQSRCRVERRFRTVPIGSRATFVALPIPRVESQACGAVRRVKIPFADPRRSSTSAFERDALELSRRMTIRDGAVHLDVSWDVIQDLQKRDLSRRFAKPKLKHSRRTASDEIAVAKGHRSSRPDRRPLSSSPEDRWPIGAGSRPRGQAQRHAGSLEALRVARPEAVAS